MAAAQRGANSPLPHCGRTCNTPLLLTSWPTRGEFAPPSLRLLPSEGVYRVGAGQRGANSPLPHCGEAGAHCPGEGWPPNEGRIRPSLIAARWGWPLMAQTGRTNEGRIRPSLIAAERRRGWWRFARRQRGANSPLPHCGRRVKYDRVIAACANEGRIRPSLIAARQCRAGRLPTGRPTRGEFAPPSLRPPAGWRTMNYDRVPTRGEFAPPSLRQF